MLEEQLWLHQSVRYTSDSRKNFIASFSLEENKKLLSLPQEKKDKNLHLFLKVKILLVAHTSFMYDAYIPAQRISIRADATIRPQGGKGSFILWWFEEDFTESMKISYIQAYSNTSVLSTFSLYTINRLKFIASTSTSKLCIPVKTFVFFTPTSLHINAKFSKMNPSLSLGV